MILRDEAQFPLARKLRAKSGAPITDVFAFLSGLYFVERLPTQMRLRGRRAEHQVCL
jgi:hypothetical protein